MADKQEDILAQFAEFLEAKNAQEKEAANSEDFDIEIWDEKGRGVRTRRSHAKPFLQSLGLDLDAPESGDGNGDNDQGNSSGDSPKRNRQSAGKQSANATSSGVARKYFVKSQGK